VQLIFRHDLVFVTATLTYSGTSIEIPEVLVDTGAASTVINADLAAEAQIYVRPNDRLRRLRGVGGHEHVFMRRVGRSTGAR
jgi:predicted aspartyl protease